MSSRPSAARRAGEVLRILAWNVGVFIMLLVVIEGASSWVLLVRDLAIQRQYVAERRHTTYDRDLGWVNKTGLTIPDMYGPGASLHINHQGFRNDADFDKRVPAGKRRVIVSGDSFTFGFGVDNTRTWAARLAALNPALEVVNMGEGGYGFDQAYLWFRRDGIALDHQVHVMAFIAEDFDRMQFDSFVGYGKPLLDVQNHALIVRNVPVPPAPFSVRWPSLHLDELRSLRTVNLLGRLQHALWPPAGGTSHTGPWSSAKMDEVLRLVLEDLKRLNDAQSSALILMHLPRRPDIGADRLAPAVETLAAHARAMGIPFIDLAPSFRALSAEEIDAMFIREGQIDYLGGAGHLNERGNEFVSARLHEALAPLLSAPAGRAR